MSGPTQPKQIRSLNRGILVVEHLSNHGLSSLAYLRQATGLSNATLFWRRNSRFLSIKQLN